MQRPNTDLAAIVLLEASSSTLAQLVDEQARLRAAAAAAERERARQERRARFTSNRSPAIGLLVSAVPVWLFTPAIVAILGAMIDGFGRIVLLGSGGQDNASGLATLYGLWAKLLIGAIVCVFVLSFFLPYPNGQGVVSGPGVAGFVGGIALLFLQGITDSGSAASWFWPPLFAVLGHLGFGIYRNHFAQGQR
ncbi:hypothetical protein ACGFIX_14215 [Nocardia salmonicida]|uniref:hypothetical protein n=1 Tax=Nocardia salmonicida TaxID=53431 RepID=UPI003719C67C